MTDYGPSSEAKISEVIDTCRASGDHSIIALAGVPGTGKSFLGAIAAQRLAGDPLFVREVQFHPSFSYQEFVEGLRIQGDGAVSPSPGVFIEWNAKAIADPDNTYVLLIEELSRADIAAVLGELLTYIEHRDRSFFGLYSRQSIRVAKNLVVLATYNPMDRSAIEIDSALLRRMRVIRFSPDPDQLEEMLANADLPTPVIPALKSIFDECRAAFSDQYDDLMPFGHGIFADLIDEIPGLNRLWHEKIVHFLRRPLVNPHPFTSVIEEKYPWIDPAYTLTTD